MSIIIRMFIVFMFSVPAVASFSQQRTTEESAKQLLQLTGAGNLGLQMIKQLVTTYKEQLPSVPADFWDAFMKEVDIEELTGLIVPLYIKYYTQEEVEQLIIFYQSPLGKKVIQTMPLIMQDSYKIGEQWGKKMSELALERLKQKGYIKNV